MEIKQYLLYLRKWAWLLVIGAVIGGGIAYYLGAQQPELYRTSTRVMVSRPQDDPNSVNYYSIYNDIQLGKTYAQLLAIDPVIQAVSDELGYQVSGGQIRVEQVPQYTA